MEKFIDKKTGKTVLKINDDGTEEVDTKYFQDIKDGTIKLTRTSEEDGHDHSWTMDEEGNGKTSIDDGHNHKIIAFNIIPKDDGHSHAFPLGAK